MTFGPPANINDFSRRPELAAKLQEDWSGRVSKWMSDRDSGLFYNAATDASPGSSTPPQGITWNGFPLSLDKWFNSKTNSEGAKKAMIAAETLRPVSAVISDQGELVPFSWSKTLPPLRKVDGSVLGDPIFPQHRQQDEYCEWFVERDATASIKRISYTAEGPEYWNLLAEHDLTLVLDLYRELVDPSVTLAAITWPFDVACLDKRSGNYSRCFEAGRYNPWNQWNTSRGAVHLTHPANTLEAEINLGADATQLRNIPVEPDGTIDPIKLICCARYGGVNRSSDPLIGAGVYGFAASGLAVTLSDPVGLYIANVNLDGLKGPGGESLGNAALKKARVSPDGKMMLRLDIVPPLGSGYMLDQCTFRDEPLTFGGQIAKAITMVLFGQAKSIPGRQSTVVQCEGKCCFKADAADFNGIVGLSQKCDQLQTADPHFWDKMAPVLPTTPTMPHPVAIESLFDASRLRTEAVDLHAPPVKRYGRRRQTETSI